MTEIVHLSLESPDRRWGGLATAVHLLAETTATLGIATTVVSAEGHARSKSDYSSYRLMVSGVPQLAEKSFYELQDRIGLGDTICKAFLETLRSIHFSNNIDVIIHNEELTPIIDPLKMEKWTRTVSVVSHGLMPHEHPERYELHEAQRRQLASSDLVFAVSRNQVCKLKMHFPELGKVYYLPLPLSRLVRDWDSKLPPPRPGQFVAAGRSVPQKGFDLLLQAYAKLNVEVPTDLHLILGHGDKSYESKCRELAAKSTRPVHFHGWMQQTSLLNLLAQSTAVVVPSRFEPLGLIAAEAMSLGRPVVASSVGGLTELIASSDVGILVPVSNLDGPHPYDLRIGLETVLKRHSDMTSGPSVLREMYGEGKCMAVLASKLGWKWP